MTHFYPIRCEGKSYWEVSGKVFSHSDSPGKRALLLLRALLWLDVCPELSPKDEAKSPSKEKGGGAGGGGLQPLQLVSTDFRDMSEKGTSGFVGYVPGM